MKKERYTQVVKWFVMLAITVLTVGCASGGSTEPNPNLTLLPTPTITPTETAEATATPKPTATLVPEYPEYILDGPNGAAGVDIERQTLNETQKIEADKQWSVYRPYCRSHDFIWEILGFCGC